MATRISVALFTIFCGGPAAAINWDGHEDWLAEVPAARAFEEALDGRFPPPSRGPAPDCMRREDVGKVPGNPYEPVAPLCGERRPLKK